MLVLRQRLHAAMNAVLEQGNALQTMLTGFAGIMIQILALSGAEALVVAQGKFVRMGSAKQDRRS